nr:hypothetical protein [Mycobacterium tuberculosis]
MNGAERAVGHEVKGDFADGDCRNGDGAGATGQVDAQRVHRGDREAAREDVDGLAVAGNAGQQRISSMVTTGVLNGRLARKP